ncbi:MAG: acyl-CoA/acyl-ACP dehydrogenase, partial [Saprospiraceae bacterium]|nr:acyl-CoA/acyl-ACP dehydrogenase [Saprospiraceae bacterium]
IKCSELNLHGIFVPDQYGGLDYTLADGMSFLESAGFAIRDNGLTFALTAQLTSCTYSINKSGSENIKQQYLPGIVKGEIILAHAISENSSGSDAFHMKSQYVRNDNSDLYEIKGYKTYCTNLPVADYVLAYINKADKSNSKLISTAFVIPQTELNHLENIDKMGLNTCKMGRGHINVSVKADQLVGKEGSGLAMFQDAIMHERIGMSALHLGTIERILFEAIKWTNTRMTGGKPLASKQAVTHPLVNIHNEWITLRSFLYTLTSSNLSFAKQYLQASILKDRVSELYVNATTKILQIYGGLGYSKEHEIERMVRDALASKIYSGTSEIQKEIVWKYIS